MSRHNQVFFVVVVLACVVGFYLASQTSRVTLAPPEVSPQSASIVDMELPNFSDYPEVAEKKSAFFGFILPLVEQENRRLLKVRQYLEFLNEIDELSEEQDQWLKNIAKRYRLNKGIDREQQIEELLLRVDQIPPSLALVQSANESAWGSSRFAKEGNNLFGQWCFTEKCGMVPASRVEGASHEVAVFSNPRKSVESYIHNLNTNAAYTDFRRLRANQRDTDKQLSGLVLAQGLQKYSERGDDYIEELRSMIRVNKLDQFDVL